MAALPIEATQMEFAHLSKLQVDKHTISSPNEDIETVFAGAVGKRTWYSTFLHPLEASPQDNKITYLVLNKPDYLAHVYLEQELPALQVKDQYKDVIQICWPHNCGNNIMVKGEFVVGSSTIIQTIDSEWLDDHQQMMMENGQENYVRKTQGNFPFLENWNTFLPSYTLTPEQPFFIDADSETAFPLYLFSEQTTKSFKYVVRRNFRDILRMRKLINGVWKEINFNKSYISGNYDKDELPYPKMWAIFYKISQAEIDAFVLPNSDGDMINQFERMIDEVISVPVKDKYGYGSTPVIDLHSAFPCKFVTIKAQNSTFERSRNYSNYTTHLNVYEGSSPIKEFTSLKYGPTAKMVHIGSHHTDRMLPRYHAPRVPYEEGYNLIPFASNISEYGFDVGVILSNLKVQLTVEMGNTDPKITTIKIYKNSDDNADTIIDDGSDEGSSRKVQQDEIIEEKEEKNDTVGKVTYKLIVRTVVSKTLIFSRIQGTNFFNVHFKAHEDSSN